MLSKGAFNALLKTLEEPPDHVKFIFATTEIRKVPVTVLSRCQRFDLRRVDVPELVTHFSGIVGKEGATAEPDALALIGRAAGGSVRDGLSILDQAIAMGSGHVTELSVRAMLGLADRGRVFDLLEAIFSGSAGPALDGFAALVRDGADPAQLIADLAEAVHIATRVRAVASGAAYEGLSAEERRRAAKLAERLSMPLLSRAWQVLLKGYEEVGRAPNPSAAAEMVLIRLCFTADLPTPDEIIRLLGGGSVPTRGAASKSSAPAHVADGAHASAKRQEAPAAKDSAATSRVHSSDATAAAFEPRDDDTYDRFDDDLGPGDISDYFSEEAANATQPAASGAADPGTFQAVVDLAGQYREVLLKSHLEERVSLVKFDRVAGAIDLFLLPGAPAGLANELREKLNRWTGRRWVVMLSKSPGEPAIAEVRRAALEEEIRSLAEHPAVRAVLDAFPDARISDVRPLPQDRDEETGTG